MADNPAPAQAAPRLARKIATAGVSFFARGLQQATTFILTILAARFILPAEYGIYTLSIVFVSLAQTLSYAGYFQFVVTQKGDEKTLLDTLFWLIAGLSTLSGVVLWLAAPWLAVLFGAPELETVMELFAYVQPFSAIAAWCSAVLMRHRKFQLNFAIMIAQNLVALVGGIVLLVHWQSLYALVAFRYLRVLSGMLFYLPFTGVLPGFALDRAVAAHATRYASALYGSRTLNFFARYGADVVLGVMFSTAEAGLYRFGNRLATAALDIVQQPMTTFALAQFGNANRNDRPFGPVLARFLSSMVVIVGIGAATIAVFVAPLVVVAFQPVYLAATGVTYALAARAVLASGNMLVEPALAARNKAGRAMAFAGAAAAAQIAAAVVAAPFGLTALAWAQAAIMVVTSVLGIALIRRLADAPLRPLMIGLAKALAVVALYGAAAFTVRDAIETTYGTSVETLVAAVAANGVLALAALALAARVRAFSLSVFSD